MKRMWAICTELFVPAPGMWPRGDDREAVIAQWVDFTGKSWEENEQLGYRCKLVEVEG